MARDKTVRSSDTSDKACLAKVHLQDDSRKEIEKNLLKLDEIYSMHETMAQNRLPER